MVPALLVDHLVWAEAAPILNRIPPKLGHMWPLLVPHPQFTVSPLTCLHVMFISHAFTAHLHLFYRSYNVGFPLIFCVYPVLLSWTTGFSFGFQSASWCFVQQLQLGRSMTFYAKYYFFGTTFQNDNYTRMQSPNKHESNKNKTKFPICVDTAVSQPCSQLPSAVHSLADCIHSQQHSGNWSYYHRSSTVVTTWLNV